MKSLSLLFFGCFLFSASHAQDLINKKVKKKSTKSRTETKGKNYTSKNGGIVVHDIDKHEVLDSTQKAEINPTHVNNNYNENTPALSPSNGGN